MTVDVDCWELAEESVRGFLFEKHIPFDIMDEWTDEIIARVREVVDP